MNLERMSLDLLRAELLREPGQLPAVPVVGCADGSPPSYFSVASPEPSLLDHRLAVARAILIRGAYEEAVGRDCIASPNAARNYFRLHFALLPYEAFVVAYLDAQSRAIAIEEAFSGTLTSTSVHPREIVRRVLVHNAHSILCLHNHPSGTASISHADEMLTATIKQALALVDVRLLDHLVFAAGQFVSMAERGLI